jgi:hypothetical protein
MSTVEKYKSKGSDFFDELENPNNNNNNKNSKIESKDNKKNTEEQKDLDNHKKEKKKDNSNENSKNYVPKHNIKKLKKSKGIEPDLKFLEDPNLDNTVYIGRKKSVLTKYGSSGSAYLGKVIEDDCQGKKVRLDGLNPHVVFIDGSRGSGKSYGLGVIAEELAKNNEFIGQIVVDPVGVFWSMRFPNQEDREIKVLKEWGLKPEGLDNLKVFVPEGMASQISKDTYNETFSIYPSLLKAEDWCLTFGIDRFSPAGLLLEKTLSFVRKGYLAGDPKKDDELKEIYPKGSQFTLDDIIYCLQNCTEFKSSEKGYKPDSIRALVSRFEAAKSWGIFSDHGTPLTKLSREKQLTVLDTSFLDDNITALVIGILARRILSARKLATRQNAVKKFDSKEENPDMLLETEIPPTWLYVDEAHTLIPSGNTLTPATAAIIEYVKQGRRPGCSMVFATQQPSAINTKVLSQVDIFISHKLVFNDDIKAINKRMPAIIPKEYRQSNFIKTLPVGVALVGDRREETSRAFILKVKPRASQHEGRDAETIRSVEELSDEEVILRASDLILKKIKNTQEIKESYAKDILDVVNIKYHANIPWKKVLDKLYENNVVLKNKILSFKKEDNILDKNEKTIEQKSEDLQDIKKKVEDLENYGKEDQIINEEENKANDGEQNNSNLEDLKNYDSKEIQEALKIQEQKTKKICECLPLRISREQAEELSKKTTKKKYLIFKEKENINETSLKHRIIYKIEFNIYDINNHYKKKECYVDSISGEFIHFTGSNFQESKGLTIIPQLKPLDLEILYKLRKKSTIYSLDQELDLHEKEIKEYIKNIKN